MDVEVFVGNLDDPCFDWDNANWSGNCPERISDFFPHSHIIFFKLIKQIENKEL